MVIVANSRVVSRSVQAFGHRFVSHPLGGDRQGGFGVGEPASVDEFAVARGLCADRGPARQGFAVASVLDQITDFPGGRLRLPGYPPGNRQEL